MLSTGVSELWSVDAIPHCKHIAVRCQQLVVHQHSLFVELYFCHLQTQLFHVCCSTTRKQNDVKHFGIVWKSVSNCFVNALYFTGLFIFLKLVRDSLIHEMNSI